MTRRPEQRSPGARTGDAAGAAHAGGAAAADSWLPAWQPWTALALFAFLLHFTWELLQVPFFRGMEGAPHWSATLMCLRTTGGDVVITLVAYGGAAWGFGRAWLVRPTPGRQLLFVGSGLVIAMVLELLSVHLWERWSYAPEMPVLLGVGLAPFLQWALLPPLTLWLARRHLCSGGRAYIPVGKGDPAAEGEPRQDRITEP